MLDFWNQISQPEIRTKSNNKRARCLKWYFTTINERYKSAFNLLKPTKKSQKKTKHLK